MVEQKSQQQRVIADRTESTEELEAMVKVLEEIQMSLEPVRDQALDKKAFFTGYAQCAEEMIKAIVGKMSFLKNQATKKEDKKESSAKSKLNGKSRRRTKTVKVNSPV